MKKNGKRSIIHCITKSLAIQFQSVSVPILHKKPTLFYLDLEAWEPENWSPAVIRNA